MNQIERNKTVLLKYIPEKSVATIIDWVYKYDFKLRIKKSRSSKYGDYRPPLKNTNHLITINHDLNPYAFLITLVHEIAHLTAWEKYKNSVKPHGEEWKKEFQVLMTPFLNDSIFPSDVIAALTSYLKNPAASSCSDLTLFRTLKQYDKKEGVFLLEEIAINSVFKIENERYFLKGEKVRKRFMCREIKTKKDYLFNPITEVTPVPESLFLQLNPNI